MATTKHYKNGTGNQATTFDFTFPYLKKADVVVKVYESGAWATKTETTHYTYPTVTSIQFIAGQVPVAGSNNIVIYRSTSSETMASTFYAGSAIRSSDLNDNFTQNLYSTQENTNDATEALDNSRVLESGSYASAITKAEAAVTTANTASTNASAAVTTANTASTNASSAVTTANTANTTAASAVTTANAATTTANTANTTAGNAVTTANGAVTTANTASTNATAAVNTANTANTTAGTANTTANTANTTAGNAVTTANTANTTAGNAVTTANSAVATANAASAAVAAAVLYTPKADKAALEAYQPTEDDYIEVSSSLNITNGTWTTNSVTYTLSGMPGTFTGAVGLTIRLAYTHSNKTYAWSSYFANDPEDRYAQTAIIDGGNFDTGGTLITTSITYDGGAFT